MKYSLLKKILLAVFIILPAAATAQSVGFKAFCAQIKNTGAYYWGESFSENMRDADSDALRQLLNQIAVNVSASFEQNVSEKGSNLNETVSKILKTYSTASLRNVKVKKDFYNNVSYVFRYIKKKAVSKIFEKRKLLAADLFQNAIEFESNANFGDALKYYYYSVILINSLPDQNITVDNTNLKSEIPKRINNILHGVRFKLSRTRQLRKNEKIITYAVYVNNKPAANLQFSFWDGNDFIDVETKDGFANIDLLGGSVNFNKLNIRIKYEYQSNRDEIKEVAELWDLVIKPTFDNDFKINTRNNNSIANSTNNYEKNQHVSTNRIINSPFILKLNNKNNCKIVKKISKAAITYLELLRRNDLNGLSKYLGNDDFLIQKTNGLIKYNSIKIISNTIHADLNKTKNGFEIREIKINNKYNSLSKQTSEYLILDFDKKGKIYDVNFGIMDDLYNDFVTRSKYGDDWNNKQIIIKFMEKYRTAYLTRDIGVIDKMFADKALIIVGRMIKTKKNNDAVKYVKINKSQPDFEQIKYTKAVYLKRQRRLFNSREDIFLGFSKFAIFRKNDTSGIYGVSLRQDFESTGYSDEGYLFLLIDFNKKNPQIYVRSWQPSEWDDSTLIGLSNFRIND